MTPESCKRKIPFSNQMILKLNVLENLIKKLQHHVKEGETFHDGICMKIKDSNNCKEELFLEPDPTKNNTVCRTMSEEKDQV